MTFRIINLFALLTITESSVNFLDSKKTAAAFVNTINSLQIDDILLTNDLLIRLNDARDDLIISKR